MKNKKLKNCIFATMLVSLLVLVTGCSGEFSEVYPPFDMQNPPAQSHEVYMLLEQQGFGVWTVIDEEFSRMRWAGVYALEGAGAVVVWGLRYDGFSFNLQNPNYNLESTRLRRTKAKSETIQVVYFVEPNSAYEFYNLVNSVSILEHMGYLPCVATYLIENFVVTYSIVNQYNIVSVWATVQGTIGQFLDTMDICDCE